MTKLQLSTVIALLTVHVEQITKLRSIDPKIQKSIDELDEIAKELAPLLDSMETGTTYELRLEKLNGTQ